MSDFIKSIWCRECDGDGKVFTGFKSGFNPARMELFDIDTFEQCFECERLHMLEVRADRLQDGE